MTRGQRGLHLWIWIAATAAMFVVGVRAVDARHRIERAIVHAQPAEAR